MNYRLLMILLSTRRKNMKLCRLLSVGQLYGAYLEYSLILAGKYIPGAHLKPVVATINVLL